MASSQRIRDDEQDFADRSIAWFEKLFPAGAIINAIFAGAIFRTPGADYYKQSIFASVASLLFTINMFLCITFGIITFLNRPSLKVAIRSGGFGKVLVTAMSLAVQLLFLAGAMFFFLIMASVHRMVAQGITGMVFTGIFVAAAVYVWVMQLARSEKGIRLADEE